MKNFANKLTVTDYAIAAVLITGAGYVAVRTIRKAKEKNLTNKAELTTSEDNPFSATTFLKKAPAGTKLITAANARAYAKIIYDALSGYLFDDPDKVIYVFASLPSQAIVAMVVESFEAVYKRNILEFLKNGNKTFDFGTGGVNEEQYQRILENVKRKPKYTR